MRTWGLAFARQAGRSPVLLAALLGALSLSDALRSAPVGEVQPPTSLEAGVLAEINAARADPAAYAAKLQAYKAHIHGRQVDEPGRPVAMTTEGAAAVDDSIAYLQTKSPLPPLAPSEALALTARGLAADLSSAREISHIGQGGSTLRERVQGAGIWAGAMEEDISVAQATAADVVRQLVVDDGVPSRGHRTAIFSPVLKIAGVGCGPNAAFGQLCVIDFAGVLMPAPGSERVAAGGPPPPRGESVATRVDQPPPVAITPPHEGPRSVCGPDITDKVYATLDSIKARYGAASPAARDEACGSLYSWSYNSAWDIDGLDPDSAPDKNTAWDPSAGGWVKTDPKTGRKSPFVPWFTGKSKFCAIPRPDDVCAATVQFDGACQHAQVVNYVMWGAVNALCGYSDTRANAMVALRGAFSDKELVDSQREMMAIGYQRIKPPVVGLYSRRMPVSASQPKKYAQCELACPVTLPAKPPFNFSWGPGGL